VAIVDDVISTGASTGTALRLLRGVGAEIVVIGTLVTEASIWRTSLGEDASMVRALGSIPFFDLMDRAVSSKTGRDNCTNDDAPSRSSGRRVTNL